MTHPQDLTRTEPIMTIIKFLKSTDSELLIPSNRPKSEGHINRYIPIGLSNLANCINEKIFLFICIY